MHRIVFIVVTLGLVFAGCSKNRNQSHASSDTMSKTPDPPSVTQPEMGHVSEEPRFRCLKPDTTENRVDTITIGPSVTLELHKIVLHDTSESSDRLAYFQILVFHRVGTAIPLQTIPDSGRDLHSYQFLDLNSDGYRDLVVESDLYDLNPRGNVWLFSPATAHFEYSTELSDLPQLTLHQDGTLSTMDQYTGGRGGLYEKFVLDHGRRKVIHSQYWDGFNREEKELRNGKLTLVALDQVIQNEKDSTVTVICRAEVAGSLRVVKEMLLKDCSNVTQFEGVDSEAIINSHLLLREVSFRYEFQENGVVAVHKTVRELHNNQLKTIMMDEDQ